MSAWLAIAATGTAFDDYIGTISPNYTWYDLNYTVNPPLIRATAHIINVTSQQWLTEAQAVGPTGALWTHQVAVVVPHTLKYPKTALAYLTGGCNEGHECGGPKPPAGKDEDLLLVADIAARAGIIAIVVFQLPNCHIVYPSDPSKTAREEDAMIAWAWREYLVDPKHDPRWLPRLPMVKGGFSAMKAAAEWAHKTGIAEIDGWVVGGASKRGWTSWMVGAASPVCKWCPKVVGLTPVVPIVPNLHHSVHLQRQSLGAFTFAFRDYLDAGTIQDFDTPQFDEILKLVDPSNYKSRLASIPKMAIVSSDDEFMQLDWTEHGWLDLPGETKLLVVPNSEHSMATGLPEVVTTLSSFVASVAADHHTTTAVEESKVERPAFTFTSNNVTGEITVTLTKGAKPSEVYLRHAQTLSDKRRDFRWVRLANETTSPCKLPGVPLKKKVEGGGNCLQPILWHKTKLKPDGSGVSYAAMPPKPSKAGHYVGYYIELIYPKDEAGTLQISTPGYVWPNTLPFPDCELRAGAKDECSATLV